MIPRSLVPFRYLRTLLVAFQSHCRGFLFDWERYWVMYPMSGRVDIATYVRDPMRAWYVLASSCLRASVSQVSSFIYGCCNWITVTHAISLKHRLYVFRL